MPSLNFTNDDFAAALVGLELERDRIGARILEIRRMLGGERTGAAAPAETARPRRRRSAAVRRKMALAQRARYAKLRQDAEPPQAAKPKKRKLSRAGKAAIVAALK